GAHREPGAAEVEHRGHGSAQGNQCAAPRVGHPAEVPALLEGEAGAAKRTNVLLEAWEIGLLARPTSEYVREPASEQRESPVHVDHHAVSARGKEPPDILGAGVLLLQPMTVAKRVDADDEVKRPQKLLCGATEAPCQILGERFVARHCKANSAGR